MSSRQILTIVGQVVGAYFGGSYGAAIGGAIGGYIGGNLDGPQKGPRLDDTSAPSIEFGGNVSRVYGRVWCTLSPLWWSKLHQSTVNTGGKGSAADETTDQFVYHCDMLGRLADGANVIAWTRIRIDGKIVGTQLADSSPESLSATLNSESWGAVELRSGGPTQMPWSVMEAAEGAGNVSAYRDQCTFAITALLMPSGRNLPLVEVEVITKGTSETHDTRALFNFTNNADDETSYEHDITSFGEGAGLSDGALVFTGSGAGSYALTPIYPTLGLSDTYTVQGYCTIPEEQPQRFPTVFCLYDEPGDNILMLRFDREGHLGQWEVTAAGGSGGIFAYSTGTWPPGKYHFCLMRDTNPANGLALWIGGAKVIDLGPADTPVLTGNMKLMLGNQFSGDGAPSVSSAFLGSVSSFKITYGSRMFGDSFTPPGEPLTIDGDRWTPGTEDLQDVLEAEMLRCAPLTIDHLDMSAAAGKEVWGFKASRSAAAECAVLCDWYYLDIFCGSKITVVERGGAVEQTIPYGYTGSGVDGTSDPFAGLIRGADVESQFATAVQYINILADGEVDTQQGQRVGTGSEVRAVNFSIYSKPTLAKGRADTITHDTRVAAHTATVRLGVRQAARMQPGSVQTLVDNKGNSYRTRVLRMVWNRGVYEVDVCLDDPNILTTVGITTEVDNSVIDFDPPATTEILLFDGPIFGDAHNNAGFYAAANGSSGSKLLNSTDGGATYAEVASFTTQSVFGDCDTVLADSTVGWLFDETSTLTVDVGDGTLSSATRAAVLADESINACAIGVHGRWEVCQFRTASMLSAGVYTLSGFLRGLRGTEWAIALHEAGEKFVLITTAARRVEKQASEIGIEELYKGVTAGRPLSSATEQEFTNNAVGLKPFAPVHLRKAVGDSGTVVSWTPRTRLATRFASPLGIYAPLGEASESYDVELRNASDVLIASDTVTSPAWNAAGTLNNDGTFTYSARDIKIVGGDAIGIDRLSEKLSSLGQIHIAQFNAATGALILISTDYIGNQCQQWASDGDDIYVAASEYNAISGTNRNSYVRRLTRGVLDVEATYTAGTPGDLMGIAHDGTNVWVSEYYSGNLRKLNATTLASIATYPLEAGLGKITIDGGSLWVLNYDTHELIEWDIATTSELRRFTIAPSNDIKIVGGLIFAAGADLVVYDKVTEAVVNTVLHWNDSEPIVEMGSYIVGPDSWVPGTLRLIDSSTGLLSRTINASAFGFYASVTGSDGSVLYVTTFEASGMVKHTHIFELAATDLTGYSVTVYQNSAVVGRGTPATLEL